MRYAVIAFVLFQFTHVKMHKHGIYIEVVSCAWACSDFFCPYVDRVNQPKDA